MAAGPQLPSGLNGPQLSARDELVRWAQNVAESRKRAASGFNLPDLARASVAHFSNSFFARLGRELAYSIVYDVLQSAFQPTNVIRAGFSALANGVANGNGQIKKRGSIFEGWFEHAGDEKWPLLKMEGVHLDSAITERFAQRASADRYWRFLKTVRAPMPLTGQRVEDRWSLAALQKEYDKVFKK